MMAWSLACACVTIPARVVVWSFVELWAKSYDLPAARRMAISVEVAVFLFSGWAALVVTAAVLLLAMHEVDWRHAYASVALGLLLSLFERDLEAPAAVVPVGLALVSVGMAVRREFASVRLRRYTAMLSLRCSCCGYKQKAVRELFQLGDAGERVVQQYLQTHDETRVASEVERCRPTRG